MTWFKVDDGFYDHPKVIDLPLAAVGLWALAGAYCARHLTDGVITDRQIRAIGGTRKQAAALVAAGLWSVDDAPPSARRFAFNDWGDFQPSRADVEAKREEARERMAAARARKRKTSGNGEMFARTDSERSQEVRSDGLGERSHYPDPARPDPSRPDQLKEGGKVVREVTGGERDGAPPSLIPDAWLGNPRLARCAAHAGIDDPPPCVGCRDARRSAEEAGHARAREQLGRAAAAKAERDACDLCDPAGFILGVDDAIRCTHDPDRNGEAVLAADTARREREAEEQRARAAAKAAAAKRKEAPRGPF